MDHRRQLEDPRLGGLGEPVRRRPTPVAVDESRRPVTFEVLSEPPDLALAEAHYRCRLGRRHLAHKELGS
jgi:hypothetical protein